MFTKKKTVEVPLSNLELVSNYLETVKPSSKVSQIIKHLEVSGYLVPASVKTYLETLPVFIPIGVNFALRFKYMAGFFPRNAEKEAPVRDFLNGEIVFAGTIPEIGLDRILEAQKAGIRFFTIHSNYELPFGYVGSDPVAIGWFINPRFAWRSGELRDYDRTALGFINFMWDIDDKELQVWEG